MEVLFSAEKATIQPAPLSAFTKFLPWYLTQPQFICSFSHTSASILVDTVFSRLGRFFGSPYIFWHFEEHLDWCRATKLSETQLMRPSFVQNFLCFWALFPVSTFNSFWWNFPRLALIPVKFWCLKWVTRLDWQNIFFREHSSLDHCCRLQQNPICSF